MTKKILIAGMVAGLVLFLWESVAHVALPLGEAGIKALPNEAAVLAALKDNIKEPGFYFFPAGGMDQPGMTKEQQQKAFENQARMMRAGPAGIMIVHPEGLAGLTPSNLLTQFAADVIVMMLAAFLLSRATKLAGFTARVGFVAMLGLFPTLRGRLAPMELVRLSHGLYRSPACHAPGGVRRRRPGSGAPDRRADSAR